MDSNSQDFPKHDMQRDEMEYRSKSTTYKHHENGEEIYVYHGSEENYFRVVERKLKHFANGDYIYERLFRRPNPNKPKKRDKPLVDELQKLNMEILDFENISNNSEENQKLIKVRNYPSNLIEKFEDDRN